MKPLLEFPLLRILSILSLYWVVLSGPSHGHAIVNLGLAPGCQDLLDRRPRVANVLSKILFGEGQGAVAQVLDFLGSIENEVAHAGLQKYADTEHPSHNSLFVFLPPTAWHAFATMATTYLDQPHPFLMFSDDQQWLVAEPQTFGRPKPLHLVVVTSQATDLTILHEASHLADMDELLELAKEKVPDANHRLLIRFKLFTLITELRAYKIMTAGAPADALLWASVINRDFSPIMRSMPMEQWLILARLFHLKSPDETDLREFLLSADPLPNFKEALASFDRNLVRVVAK